jgi:hypothetical protein
MTGRRPADPFGMTGPKNIERILRGIAGTDPSDDDRIAFMELLKFLASLENAPDMRFDLVDEDGNREGEMIVTNDIPPCVECGTVDAEHAFQDQRFADGGVLCETCYVPYLLEWERENQ